MWALGRVQRLLGDEQSDGTTGHNGEIVRLCEGYSIVSPYASFIVLENDAEYKRWSIERRNATRIERDRAAQLAVRQQLEQLRNQALAQLGVPDAEGTKPAESARANSSSVTLPAATNLAPTASSPPAPSRPARNHDFSMPSRGRGAGGGGAIDPVTAAIALGLAGAALAAARRGRRESTARKGR
mgnify:CR=1 FL=1